MDPITQSDTVFTQSLDELLTDFRNCLVVKCLTQYIPPESASSGSTSPIAKLPRDEKWEWRNFLRQICALGHNTDSAKTVTSIIVPVKQGVPILCVATNDPKYTEETVNHIRVIWRNLKKAVAVPLEQRGIFVRRIYDASVKRSYRRIKDYRRALRETLNYMKQDKTPDATVLEYFIELLSTIDDPTQLAQELQRFKSTPAYTRLYQLGQQDIKPYRSAWHLVGRLSLWMTAAEFIVAHAGNFKTIIETAKFEEIKELPPLVNDPRGVAATVGEALGRVYGDGHPIAQTGAAKLAYAQRLLDKLKGSTAQQIHSEMAAAQHCSAPGLRFAFNDPFIACSKPCCYACHLYLRLHPINFSISSAHGNAWQRWSLSELPTGAGLSEGQLAKMLRQMSRVIRDDVARCIAGNTYGRRQAFESTTGMP